MHISFLPQLETAARRRPWSCPAPPPPPPPAWRSSPASWAGAASRPSESARCSTTPACPRSDSAAAVSTRSGASLPPGTASSSCTSPRCWSWSRCSGWRTATTSPGSPGAGTEAGEERRSSGSSRGSRPCWKKRLRNPLKKKKRRNLKSEPRLVC